MRPINLKISAFGPYKDEVYIDFTKFDGNGIFLITGDTGSGKTTIFDAICFALFGIASGSNRGKNSFRSDFAGDNVKTYVILEFIHKGIHYKIERNPSYMRRKKRGEGYTQVSGDASITYLDKVITGDKNVTDKCVEILGINAMQFKQISMIAQGEFLKLLLAKPSERADIFRRIFDTYIYRDISDNLKKKHLSLKREYEDIEISIDNLKESFILEDNIEMDNFSISDFLELVSKAICSDETLENKLEEKKIKILNKIQKITSDIGNATLVNDNFSQYETNNEVLKMKLSSKGELDKKRILLDKNKDIMEQVMPFYNEVVKVDKFILEKTSELEKNEELYNDILENYNTLLEQYKKLDLDRERIDELKLELNVLEKKLPLFLEIDKLNCDLVNAENIYNLLKLEELYNILKKINHNKKLHEDVSRKSDILLEIKNQYNELSHNYNLMYNKFINCQAGIIAVELKDNCPCPVCGSLEHPHLASLDSEYITKEELDSLKSKLDENQKKLEKISSEVSSLKKELEISDNDIKDIDFDDVNEKIQKCKKSIIKDMDVRKYNLHDISNEISYIKANIDSKKNLIQEKDTEELIKARIHKIELGIKKVYKYIEDISYQYEDISKKKVSIESIFKVIDKEIMEFKKERILLNHKYIDSYKKLGYETEEDYLTIKLDQDLYIKYEDEINNYDKEICDLRTKINTLGEILKGKQRIDIEGLEQSKKEENEKLLDLELSLKKIHSRIINNKIGYDRLNSVYKKVQKLEEDLSLYEDLSNTANGNIRGKNKLEFEQYVQASYFDSILVSANERFSYMTDSRYLLARKVEATRISDKLGLELEVIDNYTGKRRDITSLSGGESFKASLSLALGMSDVIQSYSGGIVVETMFIDEGFGSLDSESLEASMNAILKLSTNDRLIGIISHVNELKDRIDKRIVVKKSNCGSNISIVV